MMSFTQGSTGLETEWWACGITLGASYADAKYVWIIEKLDLIFISPRDFHTRARSLCHIFSMPKPVVALTGVGSRS